MEIDKISENILKRKTLDKLYDMLKKKKSIYDSLYSSIGIYQAIGINSIGTTLEGEANVNLQSVSTLPNHVVNPFYNSIIENNVTTNQDFLYFSGNGIFGGDNLDNEAYQPSGSINASSMFNIVIPEPIQPTSYTNIDLNDDDW